MRAFEFITEVIDTPVPAKIVQQDQNQFVKQAIIDNRPIEFRARRDVGADNIWYVSFKEPKEEKFFSKGDNPKDYLKTGKGGELAVFSFVKQSLDEFNSKYNPKSVGFTADKAESSRSSLYKRMVNRWSKELGFQLNQPLSQKLTAKYPNFEFFVLDRVSNPAQTTPKTSPNKSLGMPGLSDHDPRLGADLDPKTMIQRLSRP